MPGHSNGRSVLRPLLTISLIPVVISAGLRGGLAGGVAMAVLACTYGVLKTGSIWYCRRNPRFRMFPHERRRADLAHGSHVLGVCRVSAGSVNRLCTLRTGPEERLEMRDYVELTKPRITMLILICTAVGFWFACGPSFHWTAFAHALLGTALAGVGNFGTQSMVRGRVRCQDAAHAPSPSTRRKN